jgi:hypothetical protein
MSAKDTLKMKFADLVLRLHTGITDGMSDKKAKYIVYGRVFLYIIKWTGRIALMYIGADSVASYIPI